MVDCAIPITCTKRLYSGPATTSDTQCSVSNAAGGRTSLQILICNILQLLLSGLSVRAPPLNHGLSVRAPPLDHTTRPPNSKGLTTFLLSDCCCKNATSTPTHHCCPGLSHSSTQVPCCCKCLTRSQKSHETRINNPGICTCNCLCGLVGSYSCGHASIKQPFAWKLQPCRQHHGTPKRYFDCTPSVPLVQHTPCLCA